MRDDFSESTRTLLAKRVAGLCSRPGCRVVTSGPSLEPDKAFSIGVAAHITAAAPGGPRFDSALSPEQRSHHSNGIWCCSNCGRLVDADESRFSVAELRQWRVLAEAYALYLAGRAAPGSAFTASDLSREEFALLRAAGQSEGVIIFCDVDQGPGCYLVGRLGFGSVDDPANSARHRDAIESLQLHGLIRQIRPQAWELTGSGFVLARQLIEATHASTIV